MAEVIGRDGTWTFDGLVLRIVPGHGGRAVHPLRQGLGELEVPLEAIAGVSYEPGRRGGRLRLRLRDGADPLLQVAGGALDDSSYPYQLTVGNDRSGVAEFLTEDVRNYLLVERIPAGPVDRYLLAGPGVPVTAAAGDGTGHFDGERIRLEWNWMAESSKTSAGPRTIALSEVEGVELHPSVGLDSGHLRFRLKDGARPSSPRHDPNALMLWGFKKEGAAVALLAAAVVARLPHPKAVPAPPAPRRAPEDPDAMVRRLRELGELHRTGVLTEEEFALAKQAVLRTFADQPEAP